MMQLYFAPLEGIGGYIYRNAQAEFFSKADKYFSPFIAPVKGRKMRTREYRDVCPENNEGIRLVPQILTNDAEAFCQTAGELSRMGYKEVNLNLGCPSKTVVAKGKGSGFLAQPELLDAFLEQIFGKAGVKISVKTRIGLTDPEEFESLLEIYQKYPIEELIIHPRVQADYYGNSPRTEVFRRAMERGKGPLVYNGDIFSLQDFRRKMQELQTGMPQEKQSLLSAVMLGRGVLAEPGLFGEIRGEGRPEKERLRAFHDRLFADYSENLSGEVNVLHKMKELWFYMAPLFGNGEKYAKQIRKAQRACDYRNAVRRMFAGCEWNGDREGSE